MFGGVCKQTHHTTLLQLFMINPTKNVTLAFLSFYTRMPKLVKADSLGQFSNAITNTYEHQFGCVMTLCSSK